MSRVETHGQLKINCNTNFLSSYHFQNCPLIFFFLLVDLLRLIRTSSGEIRDKTQCKINKVMMGKVTTTINKKHNSQIVLKSQIVLVAL